MVQMVQMVQVVLVVIIQYARGLYRMLVYLIILLLFESKRVMCSMK